MLRRVAAGPTAATAVRRISSVDAALRRAVGAAVEARLGRRATPADGAPLPDFVEAVRAALPASRKGPLRLLRDSQQGVEVRPDGLVALRDNRRDFKHGVLRALAAVPDAGLPLAGLAALLRVPNDDRLSAMVAALDGSWLRREGDLVVPLRETAAERDPAIRLLRRVLMGAPEDGIPLAALPTAVADLAAADAKATGCPAEVVGEMDIPRALGHLAEWHFTHDGTAFPFDWDAAVHAVWARLPAEGVPTGTFHRWLGTEAASKAFADSGVNVAAVLLDRYGHLFHLRRPKSRGALAGTLLVSPRDPAPEGCIEGDLCCYARHTATSAQWCDLDAALPALPRTAAQYGGAGWLELLDRSPALDTELRLMARPRPDVRRCAVFVDGDVAVAAVAAALRTAGVAARDVCFTVTAQREGTPARDGEALIAPAWVRSAVLLGARAARRRVESALPEEHVVVCPAADEAEYADAFAEVLGGAPVTVVPVSAE